MSLRGGTTKQTHAGREWIASLRSQWHCHPPCHCEEVRRSKLILAGHGLLRCARNDK